MANHYDFEESNKKQQTSVKRAGTGFLDLLTENLVFIHEDAVVQDEGASLNVSHVYNDIYRTSELTYLANGTTIRAFAHLGMGWKTNLHQYFYADPEDNTKFYYINQNGYKQVFRKINENGVQKIVNEDGQNLIYNPTNRILSDKNGNKWHFDSCGKLKTYENSVGRCITIEYDGDKITKITDSNSRSANFNYDTTSGLLISISYGKDSTQRTLTYEYNEQNQLVRIGYGDGNFSTYTYNSEYKLENITDQSGYKIKYIRSDGIARIHEYTETAEIADGAVTTLAQQTNGTTTEQRNNYLTIHYNKYQTLVDDNKNKVTCYFFDDNQKYIGKYVKENSDSVTQLDHLEYASTVYTESGGTKKANQGISINLDKHNFIYSHTDINPMIDQNGNTFPQNIFGNYDVAVDTSGRCVLKKTVPVSPTSDGYMAYAFTSLSEARTTSFRDDGDYRIGIQLHYQNEITEILGPIVYSDFPSRTGYTQFAVTAIKPDPTRGTVTKATIYFEFSDNVQRTSSEELPYATLWNVCMLEGGFTKLSFDKDDNNPNLIVTTIEDENGDIVVNKTDGNGLTLENGIKIKNGNDYTPFLTTYSYNSDKTLAFETDFRGVKKTYGYTPSKKVCSESTIHSGDTNTSNAITELKNYNSNGTLVSIVDSRGFATALNVSPAFNEILINASPLGHVTDYSYNDNGDCTSMNSTANNSTTSHAYSYTKGYLTKVQKQGLTYLYTYDGFGRLTKVIKNGIVIKEYEYKSNASYSNGESNYTLVKHDGYIEKEYYRQDGKPIRVVKVTTDSNNNNVETLIYEIVYDNRDNVAQIIDHSSGTVIQHVYSYTTDGQLARIQTLDAGTGNIINTHDDHGRLISKTVDELYVPTATNIREQTRYDYTYDTQNGVVCPDNRLKKILINNDVDISYSHDNLGRLTSRSTVISNMCGMSESYQYMGNGIDSVTGHTNRPSNLITNLSLTNSNNSSQISYHYDAHGNITHVIKDGKETKYTYDKTDRLVREDNDFLNITHYYNYDANGNRTYEQKTYYLPLSTSFSQSFGRIKHYTYDGDKLTKVVINSYYPYESSTPVIEKTIIYDNLDRPVSYFGNNLTWTRGNKLASFGSNSYAYDINGYRVRKFTPNGNHKYYRNGEQILAEEITVGNTVETRFYYYDASGITGMKTVTGTNVKRYFFQKNIQGDVINIVDGGCNHIATYHYDAWGNVLRITDNSGNEISITADHIANKNPFRFRGYYYDSETGLYYLNARYYDPETGRFISKDDVDYLEPDSVNGYNLFTYCYNNPIMYSDPSGNFVWGIIITAALIAIAVNHSISLIENVIAESNLKDTYSTEEAIQKIEEITGQDTVSFGENGVRIYTSHKIHSRYQRIYISKIIQRTVNDKGEKYTNRST